jgi:hypothetical protein
MSALARSMEPVIPARLARDILLFRYSMSDCNL